MSDFNTALKIVLKWEGGYVDHPRDPGGATNLGITRAVYEQWLGRKVTKTAMRKLTHEQVEPIYKEWYWDKLRAEDIPHGLDICVFDFGVNAGVHRSSRYLQRTVGATQDGIIGPLTLKQVNKYVKRNGVAQAIQSFSESRRDYYRSLHHFDTFGKGWLNRTNDVEQEALKV